MRNYRSVLLKLFISVLALNFAYGATVEELSQRLYRLEDALQGQSPILPMDASKFRLGGFLTSTHSVLSNDKRDESSFNSNRFELLIGIDVSKDLEFFTAFGIISESELQNDSTAQRTYGNIDGGKANRANKVPLIISHGTWKWNRAANLKFGRFVAPIGIINIEHFPPGLFLETAPQALRPIPGGTIWAHFVNGVDFYGSTDLGNVNLKYHLNYGSFSFIGPANPVTGGAAPAGDSTRDIYGGRLAFGFFGDKIVFGTSFQNGLKVATNSTVGTDFYINWNKFILKTEFTTTSQAREADEESFMIQPSYALTEKIRFVLRYDSMDPDKGIDNNSRVEKIVGINWTPIYLLRIRTEYALIEFDNKLDANGENPDYKRLTTSAVLSF